MPKVETLRHKEAFEYYYSLGEKRNLIDVAEHVGVSKTAAEGWSSDFGWRDRVVQRDIDNAKKLEKKTNKAVIDEKAKYRQIIKAGIAAWVNRFQNGEIELKTVKDLECLVKLDLLLLGEATEKGEITGQVNVSDERRIIEQELNQNPETRELLKELYRNSRSLGSTSED